ncbi:MAG: hypothetical protein IPL61_31935 [Myxococcales bacterium]|nr:hypothetical protein [Myxococcales bacterium]
MRVRSLSIVGAGLGCALAGGSARADANYSLHVVGTTQVSWTDNLFAVPDDAVAPLPPHEGDFQIQFRPGVLGTYETQRTTHNLEYDLEANLYLAHDEARSLGHHATWRGFYLTSPRTELNSSVTFSAGTLAALSTQAAPSEGQPVATVSGNGTFWGLDAGQGLNFGVTPELRLTQGLAARRFSTSIDGGGDSGGYEVGGSLGADRGWKRSALAIHGQARYVTLEQGATDARSINSNLVLSFRRDFTPRWTALADVGGAWIASLDDAPSMIQPTFGINVGYTPVWGSAGLALRRSMAPNLYIAENTISDSAIANASLPLPWLTDDPNLPRLVASGALGASRNQIVRGDQVTSSVNVVNADVALTYAPRGDVTVTLRAQHLRQIPGTSTGVASAALEYDRTTFVVQATFRFPERLAAEIPQRDSLRVDRSDNTPVGDEVTPAAGGPGQ